MTDYISGRRATRRVTAGGAPIGGGAPVSIQSMIEVKTADAARAAGRINALAAAGCEICRAAVADMDDAAAIARIKPLVSLPIVADIHFDYRLALAALESGADKLRLNPGNIPRDGLREVARAAAGRCVPIRVGVNGGSLGAALAAKSDAERAKALAGAALDSADLLESCGFSDIVLSMKAASVPVSVMAHEIAAAACDYPFHVGITEAGTLGPGSVKSAAGIGAILSLGIGDTIRVSLTADPAEEIACAKRILQSLGLRRFGAEVISCPTCGRTRVGLIELARRVEGALADVSAPITVAVMGCAVNGPGEARDADVGVACGDGCGLLFRKGEIVRKVPEQYIFGELMKLVEETVCDTRDRD
ncbi:MAG: flavodoxin-dependent (E)-4-hydroxy-3-methylbut-2-enyl-diphosphate synthase [Clostridiales bacterium]|jgi:(E)-4-hydroxy-3-methylbut-2-enyl-diphosphate synthase|nr:flavodoxin-dependent (E)-4-hydroxy-3-methylbut-2-enyl-diphosphate synthase [Clostridiales bacterium]